MTKDLKITDCPDLGMFHEYSQTTFYEKIFNGFQRCLNFYRCLQIKVYPRRDESGLVAAKFSVQ